MPVPSAIVAAIVNSVANAVGDLPPQPTAQESAVIALARSFPPDAKKGELLPPIQRELQINGATMIAAPGLQVRGKNNLIVMPNTLQGAQPIRYQLDQTGNVLRIWILTAAEQAAPDPKP